MRRLFVVAILLAAVCGCAENDGDDVAKVKTPLRLDQVPAVVLQAAKKAKPELTFFAAAKDKFNGQETIELKGRNKNGKITELEVSPEGKVLGVD